MTWLNWCQTDLWSLSEVGNNTWQSQNLSNMTWRQIGIIFIQNDVSQFDVMTFHDFCHYQSLFFIEINLNMSINKNKKPTNHLFKFTPFTTPSLQVLIIPSPTPLTFISFLLSYNHQNIIRPPRKSKITQKITSHAHERNRYTSMVVPFGFPMMPWEKRKFWGEINFELHFQLSRHQFHRKIFCLFLAHFEGGNLTEFLHDHAGL